MRRNADELIQTMESTNILKEQFMTNEKKLSEYLDYQDLVLKMVFNDDHAKHLRFEDVIKHFESIATQKGLNDDPTIIEAIEDMKKIAKEIAIMISGVNGEKQIAKAIQYARRKVIALPNVILSEDDEKTEIDQVLVTSTGILLLEVKNYKKDITITEGGCVLGPNNKVYSDKCLGEQMNVKRYLLTTKLKELIKTEGLDIPVVVDSIVVFSNSSIQVNDQYKKEKYCFKSNLPHEIDDHRSTVLYSESQMMTLSYLIKELAEEEVEYEVEMDFDRIRHTFASALEKIESPTEDVEAFNHPKDNDESTAFESIRLRFIPVSRKNVTGACLLLGAYGLMVSGLTYLTCKKLKLS